MLNICLASLSPSFSFGFFKFATAKKHKEHNEEREGEGRTVWQIKEKLCQRKLFNIYFFAWAATVSHKEAGRQPQAGSGAKVSDGSSMCLFKYVANVDTGADCTGRPQVGRQLYFCILFT